MDQIQELRQQILEYRANHMPESLTDEEIELLGLNSKKEEQTEDIDISNSEVIDTLRDNLKDYSKSVEEWNEEQEQEIKKAREIYSTQVVEEMEQDIKAKYDVKKDKYRQIVKKYADISVDYLNLKIDTVNSKEAIPQEALTEIALLEKIDKIELKEMEQIVNRYKTQPLVLRVLKQMAGKHNLYIQSNSVEEVEDLPNQLKEEVAAILNSDNYRDLTYTQKTLLADSGNGIDFINERIDNFINGGIEVLEGYNS